MMATTETSSNNLSPTTARHRMIDQRQKQLCTEKKRSVLGKISKLTTQEQKLLRRRQQVLDEVKALAEQYHAMELADCAGAIRKNRQGTTTKRPARYFSILQNRTMGFVRSLSYYHLDACYPDLHHSDIPVPQAFRQHRRISHDNNTYRTWSLLTGSTSHLTSTTVLPAAVAVGTSIGSIGVIAGPLALSAGIVIVGFSCIRKAAHRSSPENGEEAAPWR